MKKYPVIIIAAFLVVSIAFAGCRAASGNEGAIAETTIEETEVDKSEPEEVPEEESIDENEEDKEVFEESSSECDNKRLEDALFSFFDAVKVSEEYKYFSSATRDMVGSEEEYKNGDITDIYFIIQESHSSWENIEIQDISIDGNTATVTFTGDRMAEGMKYEGEEISFNFVKEDGEWKIDFSY